MLAYHKMNVNMFNGNIYVASVVQFL